MIRLETHCHTKFSKDSLLPFTLLYLKCKLCGISCIAITEHNNIIGATKFKEYCRKRKSNLCVIVGEEIMTESGEVIGLYLKKEIPQGLSFEETIAQIREQKGIVYVPHPYDEKRNKTVLKEECIKRFAPVIDCIECHNGRNISPLYDEKQQEIATKYGITKVIGSDAHTFLEIGRNYMNVESVPDTPEKFRSVIATATFHEKKCIKLCHQITRCVKLIRIIEKGNIDELYRIVNKRLGKRMR